MPVSHRLLSIQPGQVDLWFAQTTHLQHTGTEQHLRNFLPDHELAEVDACLRPGEKINKAVARTLLRMALSRYAALPPHLWRYRRSLHGKPEIDNPGIDLRFNLSHCRDLVVCAVTRSAAIGVDVERIRTRPRLSKVSAEVFDPQELFDLGHLDESGQTKRFFDYWTLKESFVKASGAGLTMPLNEVGFKLGLSEALISIPQNRSESTHNWRSWLWPLTPQHRLALTLKDCQTQTVKFRSFHFLPSIFSQ